jgi:fido (protein-threonine AMPylation protein)
MPQSHHIWRQIQGLGLLPGVDSLEDYEDAVAEGSILAARWLQTEAPDSLSILTAQRVHWLMFQSVHPWAGNLRSSREVATIAGYVAAEAWRIGREFELLKHQVACWSETPELPAEQNVAFQGAFLHARFERIHPFRDGNGRVGRALVSEFLRQNGLPLGTGAFDREAYFDALRQANKGNLHGLATLILAANDLPPLANPHLPSLFRLAPRMFETVTATLLDDDLVWSRLRP